MYAVVPNAAPPAPKPKAKARPSTPPREKAAAPKSKKRRGEDSAAGGSALIGRHLEKYSVGAGEYLQYAITDYNEGTAALVGFQRRTAAFWVGVVGVVANAVTFV